MRILRTVPNIHSLDLGESERFYRDALGYDVVMKLDWIVTFASATQPLAQLSVITHDPAGVHADVSVEVDDVDDAHRHVTAQGYDVIYGPCDEPWGVRRFFAREPNGRIINVVMHHLSAATSVNR